MDVNDGGRQFRCERNASQEDIFIKESVPVSTRYKTKWAVGIFKEWQSARRNKRAANFDEQEIEDLTTQLEVFNAESLALWLGKFVQEVVNKNGGRYPARSLYGIISGIKRYLEEKNSCHALNPLDKSDKRFERFHRLLDAEMKVCTREGVGSKQPEKESITEAEEEAFWANALLGKSSSQVLLNTVYFYNGKLFGLRSSEHRAITLNNFTIGENFITFEENVCKTFHGGLTDLKYKPRIVKHICHEEGKVHESRCLVDIYKLYIRLAKVKNAKESAFYFRPNSTDLAFDKSPVGVNTLSKILPSMCKSLGFRVKTSHSLRVTCATSLFQRGIDEKLIRERTGHRSNALFAYEKSSIEQQRTVSDALGPAKGDNIVRSQCLVDDKVEDKGDHEKSGFTGRGIKLDKCVFTGCNISFVVDDKE